jgi:hypothetical protein
MEKRRENLLPLPAIEPIFIGHSARSIVVIPTSPTPVVTLKDKEGGSIMFIGSSCYGHSGTLDSPRPPVRVGYGTESDF